MCEAGEATEGFYHIEAGVELLGGALVVGRHIIRLHGYRVRQTKTLLWFGNFGKLMFSQKTGGF